MIPAAEPPEAEGQTPSPVAEPRSIFGYCNRLHVRPGTTVAFCIRAQTVPGICGVMGGGAAGEERDAAAFALETPRHARIVSRSRSHPEGMMLAREEQGFPVPPTLTHHGVRAGLAFCEIPSGGAMLSVGSMAWCGNLSHNGRDNGVARLTRNALRGFPDPARFSRQSDALPSIPAAA